jgi:hypothetical protein
VFGLRRWDNATAVVGSDFESAAAVDDRMKEFALQTAVAERLQSGDLRWEEVVPGLGLHQELAWFVEAGLSPYDALVTATRAPAEFLNDDSFGTIAEGQRADLVLLEANPLENIGATREIAGVAMQNRWLPRSDLDAMLDGFARRAKEGTTVP